MQISYNWLSDYLPYTIPVEELSDILTNIGLEVEAVEKSEAILGGLEGLVIGEVLTCNPHPNADKLKLTTVNIGSNTPLNIVCGAPNVGVGQKVVVATIGAKLYPEGSQPLTIKKSTIRGEVSEGMLCAEDEIGLGKSHAGIINLPIEVKVGTLAKAYYQIPAPDFTIHIGLTPNRSDAESHLGVARDVCAYLAHHKQLSLATIAELNDKHKLSNISLQAVKTLPISIKVEDTNACPRYAGVVVDGVTVSESPEWLKQRLKAIGIRSINNIVDITNFVLHEYGQPLHAFDYSQISENTIIVKKANDKDKFITLDEVERILTKDDLMICDAEKPMCMAGVYGGKNSGVTEHTTTVFIESAYFDPKTIRRTSLHHQLRTDAATHFEKMVDINNVIPALKRAAILMCDLAGGKIASEVIDNYPLPFENKKVDFKKDYIQTLCGKDYSDDAIHNILQALGFEIINNNAGAYSVKVPLYKSDIHLPADIAEEILRIDGLNNVPIPSHLNISLQPHKIPLNRKWTKVAAEYLSGKGLNEIITNSITNSKYYPNHNHLVKMMNNLSADLDILRPQMLESGLEVIARNANRKIQNLALYEIGNIYWQDGTGKYCQKPQLAIWLSGNVQIQSWQQPDVKADIYYLKGLVQSLFDKLGIKAKMQITNDTVQYLIGKKVLAAIHNVDKNLLNSFEIKQAVYFAEIDINILAQAAEKVKVLYQELTKYPAVNRDLAIVVDKSLKYDTVVQITQKQNINALRHFDLFDVFESEKLGKDKKSLALSFTFQQADKTLTDIEVDAMMQQLIIAFKKDVQAEIRS